MQACRLLFASKFDSFVVTDCSFYLPSAMATGIEVFSAITGCISLAIQIYTFVQDEFEDEKTNTVILSIKNDATILGEFFQIFDVAIKNDVLSTSEKYQLNEICLALKPPLQRVYEWIVKKQLADLTSSIPKKLVAKAKNVLYKQKDLERISGELFRWTERYHIRLGLLPVTLREKLLDNCSQADSAKAAPSTLRETFRRLTSRGEGIPYGDLMKEEGDVSIRSGRMASRMLGQLKGETVIVEFKCYKTTLSGTDLDLFKSDIDRLTRFLSCADTSLCRIPRALGYFHHPSRYNFTLIYQVPPNIDMPRDLSSPVNLSELIRRTRPSARDPQRQELLTPQHPLEHRFEFARKIASAVMYVHVMQYVHKSIRTSNVVVFERKGAKENLESFPKGLGEPFLCGFETARHDKAISDQTGDAHFRYNIYRHPKRQGLYPQERYTMNHDIYSLGVVLLELGLWIPLLNTNIAKLKGASDGETDPEQIKQALITLAEEKLAVRMGSKYRDVVLFCLNIDGDGQVGNSTAIEQVLTKLEELSTGMQ